MKSKYLAALAACGACVLVAAAAPAYSQQYPSKVVRVIVPFAPGGGSDITARQFSQKLSEALGQQFIVDNRGGAGGLIGMEMTAKAPPDGYTIMIATPTMAVNPTFIPKLPYDTIRDFAPVSLVATSPHLLAIHPSIPARNVKELVALAKSRPGQLTFSGTSGGSSHLTAELFSSVAGIKVLHVPYKSTGQAVLAIVTGEVSLGFNDVMTNLPQMRAGRLRGLAVTSLQRSSAVPELPTIDESGYKGFQSGVWYGVVAPARTPTEIIGRLNAELVKIARQPDFVQKLAAQGAEVIGSSPERFGAHLKAEISRWARIIREAGIRSE
jgi:tripartite-type tricarboxylate transporter receptor subunit TctC